MFDRLFGNIILDFNLRGVIKIKFNQNPFTNRAALVHVCLWTDKKGDGQTATERFKLDILDRVSKIPVPWQRETNRMEASYHSKRLQHKLSNSFRAKHH